MIEILRRCFNQYNYSLVNSIQIPNLEFYKNDNPKIASYFLVVSIDCTDFEDDESDMQEALMRIELEYVADGINANSHAIKEKIIAAFENQSEASQIDKNTATIYLLKMADIKKYDKHRNLIYAVEESPNFFLRYVLPYTQVQAESLISDIDKFKDKPINEVLSDIANDTNEYYKLMNNRNNGSSYELAIRLFSKVPFLQYNFPAAATPKPIEEDALDVIIRENISAYHDTVVSKVNVLEQLLELEDESVIDGDSIEREIAKLLGGN